jgi:hypothetical protein
LLYDIQKWNSRKGSMAQLGANVMKKEVMKCKDREMIIVEADDEIIEPDNVEDIFVSETDTALKILLGEES